MNIYEESAVTALDVGIGASTVYPKRVSVGGRLFNTLYDAGRVNIGSGVFGYTHFLLDQKIMIFTEPCMVGWDFRLEPIPY